MNISGVRIFLQKAQKPFRKDPVAGHIGVVEKLKQKVIEKIGNILPASAERDSLKHLKGEKVPAGRFLFLLFCKGYHPQ